MKSIKWTSKINPYKLVSLYQKYMENQADVADVDNVGIWLLLRVKDILLISECKCVCPECNDEFKVQNEITNCPNSNCQFSITREQYHTSWQHKDLWCGKALPSFTLYFQRYPCAKDINEKMILIDTLIHSFHIDLKLNLPNRSAGNNLIEGSLKQVVEILDNLSGIQPDNDLVYKDTVQKMWNRRRGIK
jgi:hypothetical protein